jgi:hypothetical protein
MPLTLKSPTLLKTARSLKLGGGKPSFASLLGAIRRRWQTTR